MVETKDNDGDPNQAKIGTGDLEGVNETDTKAGNGSKGESKGSHKAETEGIGGELHQVKKGTDQAKDRTRADNKARTSFYQEGNGTNPYKKYQDGNGDYRVSKNIRIDYSGFRDI